MNSEELRFCLGWKDWLARETGEEVLLPRINSNWLMFPFLGSQLSTSLGRSRPPKQDGGLVSLRNTEVIKALWKATTHLKLMRSCAGPFCINGISLHKCRKDY